jgi:hypothetical protein
VSISVRQLLTEVIRPTLEYLDLGGEAAEQLLLGTAAQESNCHYLRQVGGGPALGLWQMEPATHNDIWHNWLRFDDELFDAVKGLLPCRWLPGGQDPVVLDFAPELVGNLPYAAAMARCHYRRVPQPLPAVGDVRSMAQYWKRWYNTEEGRGRIEDFVASWEHMVAPVLTS